MSRVPYGMRALARAIGEATEGRGLIGYADPDGLDTYRTLLIDGHTAHSVLGDQVMQVIGTDERVTEVVVIPSEDGQPEQYVQVHFVSDRRADSKDPWPILELMEILSGQPEEAAAFPEGTQQSEELHPTPTGRLIRCPVCDEAISTDGTYVALEHHDDLSHTALTAADEEKQ